MDTISPVPTWMHNLAAGVADRLADGVRVTSAELAGEFEVSRPCAGEILEIAWRMLDGSYKTA